MKFITTFSALALGVLFLASCSTVQGVGKDVQKGGQAIQRAAE